MSGPSRWLRLRERCSIFLGCLFFLTSLPVAQAETPASNESGSVSGASSERIAFLQLQMLAGGVHLLGYQIGAGHLKSNANGGGPIEICVQSAAGDTLWQATTKNPALRHLEWEDPGTPGRIRDLNVAQDNPVFTVRVPLLQENQLVRFFELRTEADGKSSRSEIGLVQLSAQ